MSLILIPAAGLSSRMKGRDKLAEMVAGEPLLHRAARLAVVTQVPVFVALSSPDGPRAELLRDLPVTLLAVPEAAEGMGGTLRGAVAALPPFERLLIHLPDLVGITMADLQELLEAPENAPDSLIWRAASETGQPGHPILFDTSLRPAFATLRGDTGARPIVEANRARLTLVPLPEDHATLDLDTPEDWAAWREKRAPND